MITQEYLKECLHYNKETGVFTWAERPPHHFTLDGQASYVNSRFAGKKAGSIVSLGLKKYVKKYVRITISGRNYLAHRLVWMYEVGEFPSKEIDHINGNGVDNRLENLREVSCQENRKNKKIYKCNKSGCCGVRFEKTKGKWRAAIGFKGKKLHLGYFSNFLDAVNARKSAEKKYGYHKNHATSPD